MKTSQLHISRNTVGNRNMESFKIFKRTVRSLSFNHMGTRGFETSETTPLSACCLEAMLLGRRGQKQFLHPSVDVCLTLGSGRGQPVGSVGRALLGGKWQHGLRAILEDTQVCCICTLWVNAGKYMASEKRNFHIIYVSVGVF